MGFQMISAQRLQTSDVDGCAFFCRSNAGSVMQFAYQWLALHRDVISSQNEKTQHKVVENDLVLARVCLIMGIGRVPITYEAHTSSQSASEVKAKDK